MRSHTRERMPPEDTARKDSSQGGKGQCRGCEACSAGLKHCRARAQTRDGMPSPWSEPSSQSPRRPAGLRPTRCLHATYGFLVEGCSPCTRTSVNRLAVPGLHVSDQSRRVGQGRRVRLCSPPETHCLLLQVTHLQEKCPRPWRGLVCNVKHSQATRPSGCTGWVRFGARLGSGVWHSHASSQERPAHHGQSTCTIIACQQHLRTT